MEDSRPNMEAITPSNGDNYSRIMIEHNSKKSKYWNAADDGVEPTP